MLREPGSLDSKQCRCAFAQAVKRRLGDEICLAKPVRVQSPLYTVSSEGESVSDLTSQNLFIKCWWRDFKSHFRLVAINLLERRSFQWYWQFITDERLKNVFVGNEGYKSRERKKREDTDAFNGLADIIGDTYDLVVIRLGYLGYKNVAMPGVLKEALLIRQAANKPTWLIEQPNSPFGPGHHSWNQDVAEYIAENFGVIDLVEAHDDEEPEEPMGVAGAPIRTSEGISIDEPVVKPVKMTVPTLTVSDVPEKPNFEFDSVLGEGPQKFKKNYKRKSSGGGGPI